MTYTRDNLNQILYPLFAKLPIDLVYLYGSRAGIKFDKLSDYDFGVLFKRDLSPKKRFDLILELFGDIAKIISVAEDKIDVVDMEKIPLLLQFNAISGKVIYNKNEERRILFETYIMGRYHDEHYYFDRNFKETIDKIKEGVYFERSIPYP